MGHLYYFFSEVVKRGVYLKGCTPFFYGFYQPNHFSYRQSL